jgi:hypothetical protein
MRIDKHLHYAIKWIRDIHHGWYSIDKNIKIIEYFYEEFHYE